MSSSEELLKAPGWPGLGAEQTLTWQSIYGAFHPKRSVRGTRIDRQGLDSKDKYLRQPVKISLQRY